MSKQYSEEEVVSFLRENSQEFNSFFMKERTNIKYPIAWMENNFLPIGINAQATTEPFQKIHVITVKKIPVPFEYAPIVAEELDHCIYHELGFGGVAPIDSKYSGLATTINSMCADATTYKKLISYNFKLTENFEEDIANGKKQLQTLKEPTSRNELFRFSANYVSNILEAEVLDYDLSEFQYWFSQRFPNVEEQSQKLLEMIKNNGYETPEKQKKLLREIVKKFYLDKYIRILF